MVQVEEVTTAKTGKSLRVKLGGTWYGSALNSGLNGAKGQFIEAEIETGKFGPWIKAWKPVVGQQNAAPQVPPPFTPQPAAPAAAATYDERNPPPNTYEREPQYAKPSDNLTPWYWPSVSNICSSAIEKGLVQDPKQLNDWALGWAQVCVAVKEQVK